MSTPVFLRTQNINQPCPVTFPNRTIPLEEGGVQTLTIDDWHRRLPGRHGQPPEQVGAFYYVQCADGFTNFTAEQVAELIADNWTIVAADDLNAAREAAQPEGE